VIFLRKRNSTLRFALGAKPKVAAMAEHKAEFYDQKANTLRNLPETLRFSETRNQLLNLARLFDRLVSSSNPFR
jgi:hypothetical protein